MVVGNHTLPTEMLKGCSEGFFYCLGKWAFTVTDGLFWTIALMAFSIVCYMATARLGTNRALGYGSFVGLVGSIWFATLNFIPWWVASAFILTGIAGIAIMVMSEK